MRMDFRWKFLEFTFTDIVDIVLVTFIFYFIINIIKSTRVLSMGIGIIMVVLIWMFSDWIGFSTISWIFSNIMRLGIIAILIVFHPELRAALVRLGNFSIFDFFINKSDERIVEKIILALEHLKSLKMGALLVFERKVGLLDIIEKGEKIDANISKDLLVSIFFKGSPLHDGAVIISGNKILATSSILPIEELPKGFDSSSYYHLGLRHRAGIGITKDTDGFSVILSEETGRVSIAEFGQIRAVSIEELNKILLKVIGKTT